MTTRIETNPPRPERYGSDAFRLEYSQNTPPQAIHKDIESFLGEYVFQLPEYDYELGYENGQLLDPDTGETMIGKAYKAIDIRKSEGKVTTREEAELEGFARLQNQLQSADIGDSVVWMSPPGPKNEGYGDWGFVYLGEVSTDGRIGMTAIRVEKPNLRDFSRFFQSFQQLEYPIIAEEFLSSPLVISSKSRDEIRDLISHIFTQKSPLRDPYFMATVIELTPYINKYLEIIKNGGAKVFEQQVFNTLINYSLEVKYRLENGERDSFYLPFLQAVKYYGASAPQLLGSCGATAGSSNDIFNSLSPLSRILNSDKKTHWDYHNGDCVVCNRRNADVGPCSICKECEKKFD